MAIYRMNDYFVKFLFGSDQNKKLCLSFINAINLLAFNMLPEEEWINSYRVYNARSHKLLTEHLDIVYIEIKKLLNKGLKDMNPIEQWGAYFSGRYDDEILKEVPILAEALKAEMHFTADEVAFYEYEMRKKEVMDRISFANQARREGKEEGMQIGRAEGEARGDKNRLLQDIRNLMESFNIPAEKAMQALKISPEEQAELLPLL